MALTLGEFTAEHEQDIAWLIALWLMIHGGDPGPDGVVEVEVGETSAVLAAMLSASLAESVGRAAAREEHWLRPAFAGLGVEHQSGPNPCNEVKCPPRTKKLGVKFNGRWHCLCVPDNFPH